MEKLIIREVRMVLLKLGWSRGFRKTPHKVGSRKSPRRVGLLQTSAGGILYPTIVKEFDFIKNKDEPCVYKKQVGVLLSF